MVLTWEDGFYEYQSPDLCGETNCLENGGNPLNQGGSGHEASYSERQIELALAKMSYCVYFMGEGTIGRVAYTGKHQWVFGDGDNNILGTAPGNAVSARCILEKYPSSWDNQFDAGIKTISVIAVPHGVVQLGSTQMIMENTEWVDHVKSAFGALQNVPGAFLSDLVSEGGKAVISPSGMPAASPSARVDRFNPGQFSSRGIGDVHGCGLQSLVYGFHRRPGAVKGLSNIQKPSTVVEAAEALKAMSQKSEMLQVIEMGMGAKGLRPALTHSGSQISEPFPGASHVDVLSAINRPISLPNKDMKMGHYGETRDAQFENSHVQHSSMGAFGRGLGPEANANVPTCLHSDNFPEVSCNQDQSSINAMLAFNRILDSKSCLTAASISGNGLQQPKVEPSSSLAPFGFSSGVSVITSNQAETACSLAGVAVAGQDSLSSFAGKTVGDKEYLIGSTYRDISQITYSDGEWLKPGSKDTVPHPERVGTKNLAAGGWDDFENCMASVAQGQSSKWDCCFAIGDELSQALGPAFRQGNDKETWEEILLPLGIDQNKVAIEQQMLGRTRGDQSAVEIVPKWGSSFVKDNLHFLESKAEPLLDAVVANASSSHHSISTIADDSFSCRTFSGLDSEMSALNTAKETSSKRARCHSSQDCLSQGYVQAAPTDCEASVDTQTLSKVNNDPLNFNMSTNGSPLKTILSSWTEDMQSMKSDSTQTSQSKKPEDLTKATRKRARPGESIRPRPKDRQQIQDRVRELREIVPNGSKCSIDALLEKTIKHMVFLQNVTLHADNLKKNGELKDDVESGASWALELGGEETGRPILVKNLNQPRQLLVEMFCEEKSHFLEIADIIRNLGLAILKGVMESRSDKIWARFVVEAHSDVSRVDIMMSLMHLLHVNNNSSSSMTMASQSVPFRSQQGVDSSSSSQTQTLCGFQQSSLRA